MLLLGYLLYHKSGSQEVLRRGELGSGRVDLGVLGAANIDRVEHNIPDGLTKVNICKALEDLPRPYIY